MCFILSVAKIAACGLAGLQVNTRLTYKLTRHNVSGRFCNTYVFVTFLAYSSVLFTLVQQQLSLADIQR